VTNNVELQHIKKCTKEEAERLYNSVTS